MTTVMMGLDPGTARFGYGVVTVTRGKITLVTYGCVETPKEWELPERLEKIYNDLSDVLETYKPAMVAIENLYFMKNVKHGIAVAQARGVALLACKQQNVLIYPADPTQVKLAVCGFGNADKKQVQKMVMLHLGLKEVPKPDDAADAVGIALCLAFLQQNPALAALKR